MYTLMYIYVCRANSGVVERSDTADFERCVSCIYIYIYTYIHMYMYNYLHIHTKIYLYIL